MRRVKFTDRRGRYRSALESQQPGYLERRFKAIRRLQRMRSRVTTATVRKKEAA